MALDQLTVDYQTCQKEQAELDRKHGPKHGIQFQWGDSLAKPEYWDQEKCPWNLMCNPRKGGYKGGIQSRKKFGLFLARVKHSHWSFFD